jgi:hypothetical protein
MTGFLIAMGITAVFTAIYLYRIVTYPKRAKKRAQRMEKIEKFIWG